jgi:hypothetical protein
MSARINTFENQTNIQCGENGHQEYTWSSDVREKVIQVSFQLIRTSDELGVEKQLRSLLKTLSSPSSIVVEALCKELLVTLYKMIGHTRDIIDGKGECSLTYMMIYTWYDFYPELARYALLSCVFPEVDETTGAYKKVHPYGSWKDIKYFCNYAKNNGWDESHPMLIYAADLINVQLALDVSAYQENRYNDISLLCKWIARETSDKFGWMYSTYATSYFRNYLLTANNPESFRKAVNKAKMDYRKLIANINKALDTIQIKQCAGEWSNINFNKTTSITFAKQKKALLNVTKNGSQRSQLEDRVNCARNFKDFIDNSKNCEKNIKGKRIGLNSFTKQALNILNQNQTDETRIEIDLLNSQWKNNSLQNGALGNFIAMVDVSHSTMNDEGNPLNAAIALGYRIAEKSKLGKKIMTFSAKPRWINLDECKDFVEAVNIIKTSDFGVNANFYAALDMILNSCIENKLDANAVSDMVLVILSDMQVDAESEENINTLYNLMEEKYNDAGIRAVGAPYKPPHILFWNLRSTNGFPCVTREKNVSMLSGFSPILLNLFCEKGVHAIQSYTPWAALMDCLSNPRYMRLETKAIETI